MRIPTSTLVLSAFLSVALPAQQFEKPTLIEAAGSAINVDVGHSAPFVTDWDGDGKKDLLVGQYGEGRLRIYRNIGTNSKPVFGEFEWFRAGGEVARVWTN